MKITKATIHINTGVGDEIYLETDLPSPIITSPEPLTVHFQATRGLGEQFLKYRFPDVPVEVVDRGRGKMSS